MQRICLLTIILLIFLAGSIHAQTWKTYADSAKIFLDQRKAEKAIEYYLLAKNSIPSDSAVTNTYAQICNTLGILYRNSLQFSKAEPMFQSAKDIREKTVGTGHIDYAITCTGLGILYIQMGKYKAAIPILSQARDIRSKITGIQEAEYARCCFLLAICHSYAGDLKEAERLYLESKHIRETLFGRQHQDYAASCNSLAILYASTNQLDKSTPLFEESRQVMEKIYGSEHPEYIAICSNLAALYAKKGQFKRSESLFLDLLKIKEKLLGKDNPEYGTNCFNMGSLYRQMGDLEKTEKYLLLAKEVWERSLGKDRPEYATSCNSLSVLYADMGQPDKALLWGLESKQLREKLLGKNSMDYAESCSNLSALYRELGQLQKAVSSGIEARQILEKLTAKKQVEYAESCNNLASVYVEQNDMASAGPLYHEAMQVIEAAAGKKNAVYASACNNLGNYYRKTGEYEKAKTILNEALTIKIQELQVKDQAVADIYFNLAELSRVTGQYAQANEYYSKALAVHKANLRSMFLFTSEKEKEYLINRIQLLRHSYFSFLKDHPAYAGLAYDEIVSGRNLILTSLRQLHNLFYYAGDSIASANYNEWLDIKEQLAFWYTKPAGERLGYVKDLEESVQRLEKSLVRTAGTFTLVDTAGVQAQLHSKLKPGEAAIEFAGFQYFNGSAWTDSTYYVALVQTRDRPEPYFVYLFEEKQLDSLLRHKTGRGNQQQLNHIYARKEGEGRMTVYDVIWKPLEEKLKNIRTIYFSPSGLLHKVAFSALPVNKTDVLGDKYQLIQLSTTNAAVDKQAISLAANAAISLYGGVQYDLDSVSLQFAPKPGSQGGGDEHTLPPELFRSGIGDFAFLTGTDKEVAVISGLALRHRYPVKLSSGIEATEGSFKSLTGKNSPGVLHIATHGFFFPDAGKSRKDDREGGSIVFRQSDNPLIRSGLALAGANHAWKGKGVRGVEDGILTAYEVSNMYLPNTRLAVLSACETGLGDVQGSEGVYGLQRAFKMAGVENLVMSLWKVPDAETSEFMQIFYKNLFAKQTIQEAFNNTQKLMRNKYRSEPYKWAAWVLIR